MRQRPRRLTAEPLVGIALILVAMILALAACGGGSSTSSSSSAPAAAQTKGGTLLITYQGEPQYLDPAIDWEGNGWSLEHTMFNTLLTYSSGVGSAGTKLVPDLATAMPTVTNGGKTYTFHLHQGVKFAPPVNREMTAADWKYSFERMMSPKTTPTPPGTGFYMSIVGAKAFNAGKASSIAGVKVDRSVHAPDRPREARRHDPQRAHDVVHRRRAQGVGQEVGQGLRPPPAGHRPVHARSLDAGAGDRAQAQSQLDRLARRAPGVGRRHQGPALGQPADRAAQAQARRERPPRRLHRAARLRRRHPRPGVEVAGRGGAGDRHRLPLHERADEAVRQPQGAAGGQPGRSTATSS